jgi:predicted transcriptional regulator of viral defense system
MRFERFIRYFVHMTVQDAVLRELHRAAAEAGRRGISVPSADLDAVTRRLGDRQSAEQSVTRLIRARRVMRVRRDLLVLPDATGLLSVEIADLVDVVAPQPYLITGGAALQNAGLTDQHFFGLVVLVPSEMTRLRFRGQTVSFFKTDRTNIWGSPPGARPRFAVPERAIVDALSHPRYGVSLSQAVGALSQAASRDSAFLDRLQMAALQYGAGSRGHGSRSSARRVGLVVERLFGADAAAPFRELVGANRAPVLLRPGGSPSGPIDATWRVVVNAMLEPETTP